MVANEVSGTTKLAHRRKRTNKWSEQMTREAKVKKNISRNVLYKNQRMKVKDKVRDAKRVI